MGFKDEKLWKTLKAKAEEEEERCGERENFEKYLTAVAEICQYGVDRAKTIRDTFPFYTLHDEVHICNVMRLMAELLNDGLSSLTRDEAALLVMAACCHDIGMSYTEGEKKALLNNKDAIRRYLDKNPSEYMKAYATGGEEPDLSDEIKMNFFRSIHHERSRELLQKKEWPRELRGRIDKEDLIRVCRSHGEEVSELTALDPVHSLDRRFCAILLRLADILDFNDSRAPQAIYEYNEFDERTSYSEQYSEEEWKKHLSSSGFRFESVKDRSYPYPLDYTAECRLIQIEQKIKCYLDWVDLELDECSKMLRRFAGTWNDFVLPAKVDRHIQSEGYLSGQYRITLEQDQVMELFVGENLYSDPAVFVRELIQNAIDAVRTRKQLDRSLPSDWTGQINIRTWSERGYQWFRIEDNGIGMTEDIIRNYFLKVGRSYYNSDEFRQEKHRCKADPDYTPVSRFGIGILSCFMGDKKTNQVEVSTKHFSENGIYYPALRLSMRGINGYYYMADQEKGHTPEPMQGVTDEERALYRNEPGTIIAVRTNLYQTGKYRGFREIIDQYVLYPEVPIHFESAEEGSFEYHTEKEFMDGIHGLKTVEENGKFEFLLSDENMKILKEKVPGLICKKRPGVAIRFVALDDYMQSPYLTGATMYAEVIGEFEPLDVRLGEIYTKVKIVIDIYYQLNNIGCKFFFCFPEEIEKNIKEIVDNYYSVRSFYEWKSQPEYDYRIDEVTDLNNKRTLLEYRNFSKPLDFDIVDLQWVQQRIEESTVVLYRSVLHNLLLNGAFTILSHNGIICQKQQMTYVYNEKKLSFLSIIMLKDKYRPMINLSRESIEQLDLETACALAILDEIVPSGLFLSDRYFENYYDYLMPNYIEIYMKRYQKLLLNHPEWEAMLQFYAVTGRMTTEELKRAIDEKGALVLKSPRDYSSRTLYSELCFAYLKNNYTLYLNYGEHVKFWSTLVTFTVVKKKDGDEKDEAGLPPSFCFEFSRNGQKYDEIKNCISVKGFCNKEHRLVKFLKKNSKDLEGKVPRLWNKILKVLMQEDGSTLVQEVNLILDNLRKITDLEIYVPDSLFLSESDLMEVDRFLIKLRRRSVL